MGDIRVVSTGAEAAGIVAQLLPTANEIEVVSSGAGPVQLKPGTLFSGNKMLIVPAPATVLYTVRERLLESGTPLFVRDEWLTALARGASRAEPIVTLVKVEIAILIGIFVPFQVLLGLTVARTGGFYVAHRESMNAAIRQLAPTIRLLIAFRARFPKTFEALLKVSLRGVKELLLDLPSGVTGEDLGFFLGRVLKGVDGLAEVSLGTVARVVLKCAVLVGGSHLPSIATEVLAEAREKAEAVQRQLTEVGITVSREEARIIITELLSQSAAAAQLRELETALQAVIPVLASLQAAMGR